MGLITPALGAAAVSPQRLQEEGCGGLLAGEGRRTGPREEGFERGGCQQGRGGLQTGLQAGLREAAAGTLPLHSRKVSRRDVRTRCADEAENEHSAAPRPRPAQPGCPNGAHPGLPNGHPGPRLLPSHHAARRNPSSAAAHRVSVREPGTVTAEGPCPVHGRGQPAPVGRGTAPCPPPHIGLQVAPGERRRSGPRPLRPLSLASPQSRRAGTPPADTLPAQATVAVTAARAGREGTRGSAKSPSQPSQPSQPGDALRGASSGEAAAGPAGVTVPRAPGSDPWGPARRDPTPPRRPQAGHTVPDAEARTRGAPHAPPPRSPGPAPGASFPLPAGLTRTTAAGSPRTDAFYRKPPPVAPKSASARFGGGRSPKSPRPRPPRAPLRASQKTLAGPPQRLRSGSGFLRDFRLPIQLPVPAPVSGFLLQFPAPTLASGSRSGFGSPFELPAPISGSCSRWDFLLPLPVPALASGSDFLF